MITGGAGFIGANFVPYFLEKYKNYKLINLDKLTYAGNLENLSEVKGKERYRFVKGDICNRELLEYLFETYDIRGVIHFAAESHVDNSIEGPEVFIKTNINGTFTLLDVARKYWMGSPFKYKDEYEGCRFHHISTDEVYGSLGPEGLFSETTPYAPHSPYAASKASSDHLARAWCDTYGLPVLITHSSNNYGPYQFPEKLVPLVIMKALNGDPIPVYGKGENIRDWLYVGDHVDALYAVASSGVVGETYNIGGGNERRNIELVRLICDLLDELKPSSNRASYKEQITFVADRPGHDMRYAINSSKIHRELGWFPKQNRLSGFRKTIEWYLNHTQWTENILRGEYKLERLGNNLS